MNEHDPKFIRFGKWLIIAGTIGFALTAILSFTIYEDSGHGALPAVSFLFILIGMCFAFPSLLEDDAGGLSSMRVCVLVVIFAFAVIALKIGWVVKTFDEWRIDSTWIYILGLAFGGKVLQKFSEEEIVKEKAKDKK